MKQTILALAVAAVAAAGAAQAASVYSKDGTSLDVYGRVQSVLYSSGTGNTDAQGTYHDNSIDTSARLGLDMRTEINQYVAAFANAEWEAANGEDGEGADGEDFNARYLFVGADFGQFGSIKAGKFEDAIKYAIEPTDIFEDFGCVAQLGNDDRRSGQIMYSWSGFGVDFNVSYESAGNNQAVDGAYWAGESLDVHNGFAASIGYTSPDVLFGPIFVRAGYSWAEFQNSFDKQNSENNAYDKYSQYAASLGWGGDTGFYTAVMYSNRDFSLFSNNSLGIDDYTVQGVEFVLRYGFMNGMSVIAGYQWANTDMDNGKDLDASTVNLEFDYEVTPNVKVWAEARWDVDTDDGYDEWTDQNYSEDVYSIGARYTF
ncbi:MAG: porin [Proteobacteria bacterium]|uniref:Porin n=1 Tax=Candidatus Avisuccinivibrio stercorigallinarum TaxID=2840704 RepID=A0A9D9GTB4_9GAMM|nr:porin [Candidatus Avisuccinivibrio stercorigallinarum]